MFSKAFQSKNLNIFKSLPDSWKNGEAPDIFFLLTKGKICVICNLQ